MQRKHIGVIGVAAAVVLAAGTLISWVTPAVRAQMDGRQHGPMGQHGPGGHGPMGPQGGPPGPMGPGMGPQGGQQGPMGPGAGMPMDMARHFIEEMIPHHEDAVVMADLALAQAEHPELRELATAIKRVQTEEIEQMRGWYRQWYGTDVPPSSMPGMHAMPDPRRIDGAQPFDKAFIEDMVPHHQMAVMMTTMAEPRISQPELKALVAAMRVSQSAEIDQMRGWYEAWYGAPVPDSHGMMGQGMGPMGQGGQMGGMPHHGMGPHGMGPQQGRMARGAIRALTEADVQAIRAGEGAGLAMAAELNGLPGPRHVLDAASSLALTPEQTQAIQAIFEAMHTAARPAGDRYLAAQESLEADLRAGRITSETLRERLTTVEQLRTELALIHIEAHLRTAAMLSSEQREQYELGRGRDDR